MPSKLYYDTTDAPVGIKVDSYKPLETNTSTYANNATMGLNDNAQEPGGGNENEVQNINMPLLQYKFIFQLNSKIITHC